MSYTRKSEPVSHDVVPAGSRCEWCGDEAVEQLTALGGPHHNQSGRFCASCATSFMQRVRADGASLLVFRPATPEQWSTANVQAKEPSAEPVAGEAAPEQSLWLCQPH